jgi:hypothetical protein
MSIEAAQAAGFPVVEKIPTQYGVMTAQTQFAYGLVAGVQSVDMPEGLLGLDWVGKYGDGTASRAQAFRHAPLSMATHYGPLAYQHGMTPYDESGANLNWSAQQMQTAIVKWIIEQYTAALNASNGPDGDNNYNEGYAIGQALHTVEDLYSPAHVVRDPKTGAITQFQDYNAQDPKKHKEGDNAKNHMTEYKNGIAAATKLLTFLKQKAAPAVVSTWLTSPGGPVAIAPGAQNGGSAKAYAKTPQVPEPNPNAPYPLPDPPGTPETTF